jgi:hypothetical protein
LRFRETGLLKNDTIPASPRPFRPGDTLFGEELTRWTIRLALAAYVGRLAIDLTAPQHTRREKLARRLWTAGSLLLWAHVAFAFHSYHNWSHAAAREQTARETAAVTGLDWGGGIWINYLLMLLWAGDAVWWRLSPLSYRTRSTIINGLWQAFFAFIAFNATVVFKTGAVRWAGLATTILLLVLAVRKHRRSA